MYIKPLTSKLYSYSRSGACRHCSMLICDVFSNKKFKKPFKFRVNAISHPYSKNS